MSDDSQRTLAHHLLDARHRAPDVLAERLLPEQLHDPRRLEHRAGPRLEVRDVKADAAALSAKQQHSSISERRPSFPSGLGEPGQRETRHDMQGCAPCTSPPSRRRSGQLCRADSDSDVPSSTARSRVRNGTETSVISGGGVGGFQYREVASGQWPRRGIEGTFSVSGESEKNGKA